MTNVLREKNLPCEVDINEIDLTKEDLDIQVDGIVTSMTMHHIKDIKTMFTKFSKMLKNGGFIAIADLDKEDGSFHSVDTGVEHFGFERNEFIYFAQESGFTECKIVDVVKIVKQNRDYGIFLMTGVKANFSENEVQV